MKNWIKLVICLLIPLVVGAIGGYATMEHMHPWYDTLNKPSFNPPNWVFSPVWTTLYVLMGISSYLIWRDRPEQLGGNAGRIYFLQLALNLAWSFLFFYFHWVDYALLDIILLWIAILTMIVVFYKINKTAGLLQIPYLLWVTFATILNAAIYDLNKEAVLLQ